MGGVAMVPGRGRKPKPTKQKQLAGNPGKRALNNNEPEFTKLTKVDAPAWMPEFAIGMWETIVPDLLANDVLTVPDLHNVESFCMAYCRWREAEQDITDNGITIHTEKTVIKNPAVTVVNEAKRQMVQFGSLLGLDPSSRQRLIGPKPNENQGNPFSDL